MSSQVGNRTRLAGSVMNSPNHDLSQRLLAGGGVLGALAASSCCLVPLALFGIGVGGAWIGYLTRLAPYQPYFLGFAAACLGLGYGLRYRSRRVVCAEDEMCARPFPSRIVTMGFVVAGVLILAVLALDLLAPFLL
jgi:mercuric ion transport protein